MTEVNFYINEYFVCLLEAMLTSAAVYDHFGMCDRSFSIIHKAMLVSKTLDNSNVKLASPVRRDLC